MSVHVIDPRDMTVKQWTDAMHINLDPFGYVPELHSADQWQAWGASLLQLAQLSGILIPNPYDFVDWREWATRTNQTLDNKV